MRLIYIGTSDFDYPLYKDERGKLWANINYRYSDIDGLYSLTNNAPDGEPNYPFRQIYNKTELEFCNEPDLREKMYEFDYGMLSRYQSDCEYFLGNGDGDEEHLYFKNVNIHIQKMIELWNKFPDDLKPLWLSLEQIYEYKEKMENYKKKNYKEKQIKTYKKKDDNLWHYLKT